jgi:glycine cleavage system regulatory protein
MATLILTIVGPDRPGLVRALSEALARHGGSWLESRMARLSGQFAGIVMVEAPEALLVDLPALQATGLTITATVAADAVHPPAAGPRLLLEVVGNDRPGIVHEITRILASHGVNIEELTTGVASGAFSGDTLFRAAIAFHAPHEEVLDAVRDDLEHLGNEMMVDIQPIAG